MIVYLVKVKDQDQYNFYNPNFHTEYLFEGLIQENYVDYITLVSINDKIPAEILYPEYSFRYFRRSDLQKYIK